MYRRSPEVMKCQWQSQIILKSPIACLVLSGVLFYIALCLFLFSSHQVCNPMHHQVTILTYSLLGQGTHSIPNSCTCRVFGLVHHCPCRLLYSPGHHVPLGSKTIEFVVDDWVRSRRGNREAKALQKRVGTGKIQTARSPHTSDPNSGITINHTVGIRVFFEGRPRS